MASDHLEPVIRLARRTVRFWHFSLLTLALTFAATLGLAELWPKQYRSEAVVYYREGMQWTSNEPASGRRVAQRLKDVLLARAQLAKVVEDLHLHPKLVKAGRMASAVEEVRRAIGFRVERESEVFAVSFTGDSPEEAQQVTARLTDLLVGENARFRSDQAEVAREFLDEEKKRLAGELATKQAAQLRFLASHPEFAEDLSAGVGVSLRSRTREDAGAAALRQGAEPPPGTSGPIGRASPDPALLAARAEADAKLRAARRELADRRARYTEEHPDVRAAQAAVKAAEETYRRAAQALDAARPPLAGPETRPLRAQKGKKAAPTEQTESGRSTRRVVALEADWARLSRDVTEARERLQQLDSRQFMASMTASMLTSGQAAQIVVIDPAFLPAKPVGMTRTRRFLMALVTACFLAVSVAVLLALRDDRVYDQLDVERLQLAPLLLEVTRRSLQDAETAMAERTRGQRPSPGVELAADMTVPGSVRHAPSTGTVSPAAGPGPFAGAAKGGGRNAQAAGTPAPPPDAEGDTGPWEVGDGGFGSTSAAEAGAPRGSAPAEPEIAADDAEGMSARRPVTSATVALALRPRPDRQLARNLLGPEEVEAERDRSDLEEELVRLVELVRVHRTAPPWMIDPRLLMLAAPDSAAAAAFRVLRQRLSEREGLRSILVTSSHPQEGKTLCAVNLALALGEAGRARVVLLEANFQHPSLARLLGFHPPACIGEQLEARRTRSAQPWVVTEVGVPWLHTAAVTPGSKAGPISDGKEFALLVDDLREAGYDYVVIDGPPILGSADANILQESVDGVLLTMRVGKSRGRTLLKAAEQIGGGKVLGVALFGT